MAVLRLDKLISSSGTASRKEVRSLVRSGRVTVNGVPAGSADMKVDAECDDVRLDGERIVFEEHRYIMMNKPAGYVSSTDDPRDATVLELLPEEYRRFSLFPAGRLDKDAEGLLILTDDGDYCHNVISPKKNVYKKYYVRVENALDESDKAAFERGITLSDGTAFLPGKLELLSGNECYVYIREGKYHQVKRMLGYLGKPVIYLKRLSVGGLELDPEIECGEIKKLSREEAELVFSDGCKGNCVK